MPMFYWSRSCVLAMVGLLCLIAPAHAGKTLASNESATGGTTQSAASEAPPPETAPVFTEEILADGARIELGETLWAKQCRHCHGASAYPGKAPKLKPRKYKPAFVFDRITNGFRKMPAWKDFYSPEERVALTVYIKSRSFSP